METFIEFRDVSFFSEDYEVLKKISVKIPGNRCTVIIGPSGCGKSTFLKVAAGIYPPDTGKVLVEEKDLSNFSYRKIREFRKNSGFVFEDSALWANNTIFQNLALPLEFHFSGLSKAAIKEKVYRILEKTGFVDEANLRPDNFSTSERKVIAFFRGIITDPVNLFMDEPVQSVDYEMAKIIIDMLKLMKAANATLIMATNNAELTSRLADYLIILKNGAVVESGEFDVVKNSRNQDTLLILSEILGKGASFDTDILNLLNE